MNKDPLSKFIENMRQIWRPLDSNLIEKSQSVFQKLLTDPTFVTGHMHENKKLYQDPNHGFILLAHTEEKGLYRPPHDHGAGWVIYGVVKGEIEMGTYKRIQDAQAEPQLVRHSKEQLKQGDYRLYLPREIHDTNCLSDSVLMLRLTSCDLEIEKQQGRMNKYLKPNF